MKKILFKHIFACALIGCFSSCNDFLDEEPISSVSPDKYLTEVSQLEAYCNGLYPDILPSHGGGYGSFGEDQHTDNQAYMDYSRRYIPGEWKTQQRTSGDEYNFKYIYSCNYFFDQVLKRYENHEISGADLKIRHYIGEMYFLRAYEYFKRYMQFGDFPIVKKTLPDQMEALTEASKRAPRNEVARFILSDLDKAIEFMQEAPEKNKTRLSKNVAYLLKSRVALFEGTWLKYFKNTPFVPNGQGWPGKQKDYNANYSYPTGDIDKEIDYFLGLAMEASAKIADNYELVENTGKVQQSETDPVNPYMDMFSDVDMSKYSEVLLWRPYSIGLGITHYVVVGAQFGDYGVGLTRGMVDGFLMENGLPIYAEGSNYQGDETIHDVRLNRDSRLTIFLKEPGQKNIIYPSPEGDHAVPVEPYPAILLASDAKGYSTGYTIRKGGSFYQNQCQNGKSFTGALCFRVSEALLNYMEACYEKNGNLDAKAQGYWTKLRERAHVNPDFNVTIAATDVKKESLNDWGAYSAGSLVDPVLYNIRRERRCELMAEALRYMDLRRWRAMDQMIQTPYHIEGFKLWGEMQNWYKDDKGNSKLVYGLDNSNSNVSSPELSKYYRPYEKTKNSLTVNGYKWSMAHYLTPLSIQHFSITSSGGTDADSPLYQNPYWPTEANLGAIQ